MQARNDANIKGIDISHYNGNVNFGTVKASGVSVVYIKASEGEHTVDNFTKAYYNGAKSAGLKIGFYHFLHIGDGYSIDNQANNFCNAISGMSADCKPCVDIEDGGYHGGDVTPQIMDFAQKVQAKLGHPCIVYTGSSFAQDHFTAAATRLDLWVADYRNQDYPLGIAPWYNWVGFQYSESGVIGGQKFDMDAFTTDILVSGMHYPYILAVKNTDSSKNTQTVHTRPDWDSPMVGTVRNGDKYEIMTANVDGWTPIGLKGKLIGWGSATIF